MSSDGIERAASISLRQFFESHPPGSSALVDIGKPKTIQGFTLVDVRDITLHCSSGRCEGMRHFSLQGRWTFQLDQEDNQFLRFYCRNCGLSQKTFAVQAKFKLPDGSPIELYKFGESPAFGPPTPARVASLIGGERDYFFKGRRAESQSMGIGAFAYYRRVVENKKAEIFEQIVRVSRLLNADAALIDELERAKDETQFTRAVEVVKHGIPQALLINGHNPLTLLHSALSEGLHAQSDQDCLELAHSTRVVLTEFVERVSTAMKDEQELAGAVSRLLQVKTQVPPRSVVPSMSVGAQPGEREP